MLSNTYFLANFRFDTAENEPAKNLQIFAKIVQNCAKIANIARGRWRAAPRSRAAASWPAPRRAAPAGRGRPRRVSRHRTARRARRRARHLS